MPTETDRTRLACTTEEYVEANGHYRIPTFHRRRSSAARDDMLKCQDISIHWTLDKKTTSAVPVVDKVGRNLAASEVCGTRMSSTCCSSGRHVSNRSSSLRRAIENQDFRSVEESTLTCTQKGTRKIRSGRLSVRWRRSWRFAFYCRVVCLHARDEPSKRNDCGNQRRSCQRVVQRKRISQSVQYPDFSG